MLTQSEWEKIVEVLEEKRENMIHHHRVISTVFLDQNLYKINRIIDKIKRSFLELKIIECQIGEIDENYRQRKTWIL